MTTTSSAPGVASRAKLKRNLGLWAIVGLGLGYMTPTVVFDTFGMVARDTNNVVPAAYLVALIVMMFTAVSYGKMAGAIPSAGSAYTYARESIHPNVGFMVGCILGATIACLVEGPTGFLEKQVDEEVAGLGLRVVVRIRLGRVGLMVWAGGGWPGERVGCGVGQGGALGDGEFGLVEGGGGDAEGAV